MFPFLFGLLGVDVLRMLGLVPKENNDVSTALGLVRGRGFMTDFKMSDEGFRMLAEYEGFRSKPYMLAGENFYTIGIGSTRIFSEDGQTSRPVKSTDYLTKEQAIFQCKMYYNNPNSPKKGIDDLIKLYGFKLDQRFYDMLCQVAYASSSFHRNPSHRNRYINMLQRANGSTDYEMLGELLKDSWIFYVKNYANYPIHGLTWSRRAFGSAQYIKGKDWGMRLAVNTVKKPY